MKGKDNRKLFEIFQPGVMDELSFWKKLGYWFKNVYWYHFKIHTLVAIFAIAMVTILICDIVNRVENDLDFILSGDTYVSDEQMQAITEHFTSIVPDINQDDKVTIGYQMLPTDVGESYDELAAAAEQKLSVSLADDRFILYILDKEHMENLSVQGAFEPLESFDIQADDRFCINISESALFQKLQIPKVDGGWYIGIKLINEDRADDSEMIKKYHAAADILKSFTN